MKKIMYVLPIILLAMVGICYGWQLVGIVPAERDLGTINFGDTKIASMQAQAGSDSLPFNVQVKIEGSITQILTSPTEFNYVQTTESTTAYNFPIEIKGIAAGSYTLFYYQLPWN